MTGGHRPPGRRATRLVLGAVLLAVPTGVRTAAGMAPGWEAELLRFAGLFVVLDGLAVPAGDEDASEWRLATAERAALVVGVLYLVSGDVLALFAAFVAITTVSVNRMVRALYAVYERAQGDVEPGRGR